MKKSISILLISLFIFSLAACGSNNSPAAAADSSTGGRMQVQAADLTGEVSSVSDNKITLKLIKMLVFGRNGRAQSDNSNSFSDRRSPEDSAANSSASRPKGSNSANPSGNQSQERGQRPQRTVEYTGETKTVTIPGDIKITEAGRRQSDDSGNGQSALSVSDIKEGDVLQIWYSQDNGEAISRVVLMRSLTGLSDSNEDQTNDTNKTGQ